MLIYIITQKGTATERVAFPFDVRNVLRLYLYELLNSFIQLKERMNEYV